MGKNPAILLYDGDWVKDGVAGCSMGAQGLWLRMCFIGHNSERYGYLQVNGLPIPPDAIARRCGCTLGEYETLLAELDRNGVPSRTPDGIIFSRRLVKDARERALATARKQNERKGNQSRSSHASVTPLSVSEDVKVSEVAFAVEAFDQEEYVRQIQAVWPKKDYSPICENEILRAFEFESGQRKCSREDAAKYVTERFLRIGHLVSNWPDDKKCKIPKLFNVVHSRGYRNADETWMQDGQSPEPPKPLKWKAKE